MYVNGKGVNQDNVYAHMWFNIVASNRGIFVRKHKDILVKQMTSQDISKAQGPARECVKKNYKDC